MCRHASPASLGCSSCHPQRSAPGWTRPPPSCAVQQTLLGQGSLGACARVCGHVCVRESVCVRERVYTPGWTRPPPSCAVQQTLLGQGSLGACARACGYVRVCMRECVCVRVSVFVLQDGPGLHHRALCSKHFWVRARWEPVRGREGICVCVCVIVCVYVCVYLLQDGPGLHHRALCSKHFWVRARWEPAHVHKRV